MLENIPADMTPVVNLTTGLLVLLPLEHEAVIKQNRLVGLASIMLLGIDDKDYQALLVEIGLVEPTDSDLGFDFFFMRCMEAVGDNENMRMDKQAYQYIYDRLRKSDYSIQYILEGLLENISSYREVGLLDGLEWLGIKHQYMIDDVKNRALARGMKEKQGWSYRTHYSVDGVETVLFENLEDYY